VGDVEVWIGVLDVLKALAGEEAELLTRSG
jgi:hypothetical protein